MKRLLAVLSWSWVNFGGHGAGLPPVRAPEKQTCCLKGRLYPSSSVPSDQSVDDVGCEAALDRIGCRRRVRRGHAHDDRRGQHRHDQDGQLFQCLRCHVIRCPGQRARQLDLGHALPVTRKGPVVLGIPCRGQSLPQPLPTAAASCFDAHRQQDRFHSRGIARPGNQRRSTTSPFV